MLYIDSNCTYTEEFIQIPEGMEHYYHFTGPCVLTGDSYTVKIKGSELFNLRTQQGYIQDILVSNTAEEREFIKSGISPAGWDLMTKDCD